MIGAFFGVLATVVIACVVAFVGLNFLTAGFTGGSADVKWTPQHAAEVCAGSFSSNRHEIIGLDPDHTGPAWVKGTKGTKGANCYVRIDGIADYAFISGSGAGWRRSSAAIEFDGPPNAHVDRFGQIAVR
jgi:hypothetical protein